MLALNLKSLPPFIISFTCITISQLSMAEVYSEHLSVISSANPKSNAIQSFVIIKKGQLLTQGIKHSSTQNTIGEQTPFVITYSKKIKKINHFSGK